MLLLRLFAARCAQPTRKKSPYLLGAPTAHEERGTGARRRCVDQQGGAKRSLRKVLSGPRELRGALRDRRIEVSSSGGWSRGVPYLFR